MKAIQGKSFKIDSIRPIYRSYAHANNIAELACKWLFSNDLSFDNPINTVSHTIDLLNLANLIVDEFNLPEVIHEIDFYQKPDIYISSEKKFLDALRTYNIKLKSLRQQIIDTASFLKTSREYNFK